jgi:hypothetical protein
MDGIERRENNIFSEIKTYENKPIKSKNIYLFPSYQDNNFSYFEDEKSINNEKDFLNKKKKNDFSFKKGDEKKKKSKKEIKNNKRKKNYKKFKTKKSKNKITNEQNEDNSYLNEFINQNDFYKKNKNVNKEKFVNSKKKNEKKNEILKDINLNIDNLDVKESNLNTLNGINNKSKDLMNGTSNSLNENISINNQKKIKKDKNIIQYMNNCFSVYNKKINSENPNIKNNINLIDEKQENKINYLYNGYLLSKNNNQLNNLIVQNNIQNNFFNQKIKLNYLNNYIFQTLNINNDININNNVNELNKSPHLNFYHSIFDDLKISNDNNYDFSKNKCDNKEINKIEENTIKKINEDKPIKKYILMSEILSKAPKTFNKKIRKPYIINNNDEKKTILNLKIKIQDKEIILSFKEDENIIKKINELEINKNFIPQIKESINKSINIIKTIKTFDLKYNSKEELKIIYKYLINENLINDNSFFNKKERNLINHLE